MVAVADEMTTLRRAWAALQLESRIAALTAAESDLYVALARTIERREELCRQLAALRAG